MIRPLNNHVLIRVLREYENVARNDDNEELQKGVVIDAAFDSEHLTASAGHTIPMQYLHENAQQFKDLIGKTVYWQQYADTGNQVKIDKIKYSLIPFYRLIGYEEE